MQAFSDEGSFDIEAGPDEVELVLTPYDGDTFLFTPPGENTTTATGMAFDVEDGTAVSVTSEFYDANGLGTWERE